MAVGCHNHLSPIGDELIESMEELSLSRLAAGEKVQVIKEQGPAVSKLPTECSHLSVLRCGHEAGRELLGGDEAWTHNRVSL
jgi:hypothetical protein